MAFLDETKNTDRVWREVRVCGNRAEISSRKRREERDSACWGT
jgi:predicted RNA-binding Zn ribbon-like protein